MQKFYDLKMASNGFRLFERRVFCSWGFNGAPKDRLKKQNQNIGLNVCSLYNV